MSRLSILARHPKRMLLGIGALALAATIAVGTGAVFTSSSANPNNTFSAGTLSQSNSKDNAAILTATGMLPGDIATGTVVITNSGDVAGTFTLSQSNITSTPGPNGGNLSTQLDLLIQDVTGAPATIYSGKFDALTPTAAGLPFSAGEARTYQFTVTFPDGGPPPGPTTGDNAFKSSAASAEFDWTATT